MKTKFSKTWNRSKQPRKQRKYRFNAPLHIKQKFLSVNLSKELRKKYDKRSMEIRKEDTVKIMRGQFRGKTGKVEKVDRKKTEVYVHGMEVAKKDGSKTNYPIHPSNLMITSLYLDDKKRLKRLKGEKKNG